MALFHRNYQEDRFNGLGFSENGVHRFGQSFNGLDVGEGEYSPAQQYNRCLQYPNLTIQNCDCESCGLRLEESLKEFVRKDHRQVDLVNRSIGRPAKYSQIHPKVKTTGKYPKEFSIPLTVDNFRSMDVDWYDRVLESYRLSSDIIKSTASGLHETKQSKMARLLEFLGADNVIDSIPFQGMHSSNRSVRHRALSQIAMA